VAVTRTRIVPAADLFGDAFADVRTAVRNALTDYDSTRDAVMTEAAPLPPAVRERMATWLDDTRREVSGVGEAIDYAQSNAPEVTNAEVLLAEVRDIADSILMGLHDEPRTVAEVGERLRELLERWE
jgi:hypothetical protein